MRTQNINTKFDYGAGYIMHDSLCFCLICGSICRLYKIVENVSDFSEFLFFRFPYKVALPILIFICDICEQFYNISG